MSTTSLSETLQVLTASAIVGTDRQGADKDGPRSLLTRAAIACTKARAGQKAGRSAEALSTCPPEACATAPHSALAILDRLLANPDAGLIDEWSQLASARGERVSDSLVPVLLDWWSRQPQRSETVFAVTGVLGPWLCRLNPDWNKPVAASDIPVDADERWQTGTPAERAAILTTIRRHDPARGLALVQSTWASDGADERRRFIQGIGERASLTDEPFLEQALDDRAKTVRQQAAEALAALPGSQLRARLSAAAKTCITVSSKRSLLGRTTVTLAVEPPVEFNKQWERDGLDESAAQGQGKRAHWLRQLLRGAELSSWTGHSGLDAKGFLKALSDDDFFDDVLTALVHAVSITPDPAWTQAIVQVGLERPKCHWHSLAGAWKNLPSALREPLLLEIASHNRISPADRWAILSAETTAWSKDFSLRAMQLLTDQPAGKAGLGWEIAGQVRQISSLIAPTSLAAFEQALVANFGDSPTDSIRASLDRARVRADMHKEFSA